jgi:hypothetical protein
MSNPYAAISRGEDGVSGNPDAMIDAPSSHPMMDRLSDVMYYSTEPNLPDEAYEKRHPGSHPGAQENQDTFLKWLGDLLTGNWGGS